MPESPDGVHSDDLVAGAEELAPPQLGEPSPPLPQLCSQIHDKLEALLHREPESERIRAAQAQSRISLDVIGEALRKYSQDELSLSYNGGKDCLVLLILYLAALHTHYAKSSMNNTSTNHIIHAQLPQKLNSVHIIGKHPFKAVNDFVTFSEEKYHLNIDHRPGPMREAFSGYLNDHSHVKAIFVGTRRTDPHGADLTHFDPTDKGWPSFMRIHPVIDWHYAEIWTFIRELGVEYCGLYDMGYTSLGGTTDTHPNPALALKDHSDDKGRERSDWFGPDRKRDRFRPAYELVEDDEERLGRDR